MDENFELNMFLLVKDDGDEFSPRMRVGNECCTSRRQLKEKK